MASGRRPHYVVTDGKPPPNVHLPVLFFTANYYLTDVDTPAHGGTEVIPKNAPARQTAGRDRGLRVGRENRPQQRPGGERRHVQQSGVASRGPNRSDRTRYITQVTYARRIVGHKYYPFMNYQCRRMCMKMRIPG